MQKPNLTGTSLQEVLDEMDAEDYSFFLAHGEILPPVVEDKEYKAYIESHRMYDL